MWGISCLLEMPYIFGSPSLAGDSTSLHIAVFPLNKVTYPELSYSNIGVLIWERLQQLCICTEECWPLLISEGPWNLSVILFCMAALIFPIGFYINEVGGQPYKLPNNTVVGSSYVLFVLSIFFTIVGLLFAGKVCLPGWWMLNCGTLFWKRARHQNCILRRMPRRDYQTLTEKRNALTFSHYALWIKKRRAFPITKYRQRWLISWAYLMQSGLHCDRN